MFDIRASWGRGFAHGPLEDLQDAIVTRWVEAPAHTGVYLGSQTPENKTVVPRKRSFGPKMSVC